MSAAGLVQFFHNVFSDIKSSRRFQVSMLLWIPLFVTICVFVVYLGEWHTMAHRYQEMRTSFIQQDYINFPDVVMWSGNKNLQSARCFQYTNPNMYITFDFTGKACPDNATDTTCVYIPLSQKTSSGFDAWYYAINCTFVFAAAPNQNNIVLFDTKGGWSSTNGWNNNWLPVRPNMESSIHFEPTLFSIGGNTAFSWDTTHEYESTVFTYYAPSGTYQMGVNFRIPFTNIAVYNESTGFDSWLLCAAWGGGIFFFYFLHLILFSIAKLFLPDDSRVYGSSESTNSEFQNIR